MAGVLQTAPPSNPEGTVKVFQSRLPDLASSATRLPRTLTPGSFNSPNSAEIPIKTLPFQTTGLPNVSASFWVSRVLVQSNEPSARLRAASCGAPGVASGTYTRPSAGGVGGVLPVHRPAPGGGTFGPRNEHPRHEEGTETFALSPLLTRLSR